MELARIEDQDGFDGENATGSPSASGKLHDSDFDDDKPYHHHLLLFLFLLLLLADDGAGGNVASAAVAAVAGVDGGFGSSGVVGVPHAIADAAHATSFPGDGAAGTGSASRDTSVARRLIRFLSLSSCPHRY